MRHLTGFAVLLGSLVLAVPALAQTAPSDGWQAYPAYNEVPAVAAGLGRVWAGTPGGLFSTDPATGEIEQTTTIDGLRGGALQALVVDEARGFVWAGYADGALDRLTVSDGTVETFLDIQRNTQFASRGVRRLRVRGDSLYVATDFGVVVFDPVRSEVRNTYARLATLPPATPVNDVLFAPLPGGGAGVWLATESGIVRAPLAATLQSPTAWTLEPLFAQRALSLALFADGAGGEAVHAGGGAANVRDLYRRQPDGTWSRQSFVNDDLTVLVPDGDRLLALSAFAVRTFAPGQPTTTYRPTGTEALRGVVVGPDGRRWVGDVGLGLFRLPDVSDDGTSVTFVPEPVLPDGPFSNRLVDVDVGPDGTVWAATGNTVDVARSAVSRLDAGTGEWSVLPVSTTPALGRTSLESLVTGPDGTVYAGSFGDGLAVIDPDGATVLYDQTNSSLLPAGDQGTFIVVSNVAFEGDRRWVASREARISLNLFAADGTWTALPYPAGTSGGAGRYTIAVDRLGQKWLNVGSGGLIVWETGADPASPADDRARQYRGQGSGGAGLPAPTVTDVVVDGAGVVWVGTSRGLATVFSPGSAFATDPALGVPQWTTTPAGEGGQRDFFLRDVIVNDLDVDPSGRVWVATTSGAYLVEASPSGSGYALARQLNAATSPLPSDNVFRIAVRASDGRVFMTTAEGLFSVAGDATAPRPTSDALTASPSPFRPSEAPLGVLVSGLASARSTVRVLTLSGELVHEASAAGGSFRWDGRDDRSGDLVSSGVYLVTAVDDEGRAVVGKVAVIR